MVEPIDFSSWVAGWTALGFVTAYGLLLLFRARRLHRARKALPIRILVTGSRGKSGTVRLVHQIAQRTGRAPYAKVTGTTAVELLPDGREVPTKRFGVVSVNEMRDSIIRAHEQGVDVAVFECMAVTPDLIKLVSSSHVQPEIAVIPTIRLDHLEEEGLTEREIATNIVAALEGAQHLVVGIDQPDVLAVVTEYCLDNGISLTVAQPQPDQPKVPGHHPGNVAVALAVAELMGVDRNQAVEAIQEASVEPRALTMLALELSTGGDLGLIDLGGANDPQSSFEAIAALGLGDEVVIPILVNRWERPLRSLVFVAGVLGRFERVGVAGPLGRWAKTFSEGMSDYTAGPRAETKVIRVTTSMAAQPELLVKRFGVDVAALPGSRLTLLLVENTHGRAADRLRATFAKRGREIQVADWMVRV